MDFETWLDKFAGKVYTYYGSLLSSDDKKMAIHWYAVKLTPEQALLLWSFNHPLG